MSKLDKSTIEEMIAEESIIDLMAWQNANAAVDAEDVDEEDEPWEQPTPEDYIEHLGAVCTCSTSGVPDEACPYPSHRPSSNDPGRPFATLSSELTETEMVEWLKAEHSHGARAGREWIAANEYTLDRTKVPTEHDQTMPWVCGFMLSCSVWQEQVEPSAYTLAYLMRRLHTEFSYRRTAAAAKLIEDSKAAGMVPLGSHWDTEEATAAWGVVGKYARRTGDTQYEPFLERSVEFEADSLKAEAREMRQSVLQDGAIRDQVQELLKEWTLNSDQAMQVDRKSKRTAIDFRFSPELEYDAPQMIFVYVPEGSRAALRGEQVWAIWYVPTIYIRKDGTAMSSWYNTAGFAGVVKSWTTLVAAKAAYRELLGAIISLRKLGERAQEIADEEPDWFKQIQAEEDEAAKPTFRRSSVPTL